MPRIKIGQDPLTAKGRKIESSLTKQYGAKKGESVLYAMKNAGKVTGIDKGLAGRDIVPEGAQGAGTLWISPSTSGRSSTIGSAVPQTTFVPGSGSSAQLPKTKGAR